MPFVNVSLKLLSLTELKEVIETPHKPRKDEGLTQDYEEWKRKILENAAKAQTAIAE